MEVSRSKMSLSSTQLQEGPWVFEPITARFMTTEARLLNATGGGHLRPFDVGRDLNPVADLIELCFAETLGLDGQQYIRQMRAAAHNPRFLRWASSVSEYVLMPLAGFVWEENDRVVGNLSLIPFAVPKGKIYLLANVAVHPDYRRQGIARALTESALETLRRRRRVQDVWLHVRADNPPAIKLYQNLGFQERGRRTAWRKRSNQWGQETDPAVKIGAHRSQYWAAQRNWLDRLYPQDLRWNIPINVELLRPGLLGGIRRVLTGSRVRQWAAERDGKLLGVLSWQPGRSQSDHLWLAAPEAEEAEAIRSLVGQVTTLLPLRRRLVLDFPADHGAQALEAVGFSPEQTLIWMQTEL